MAESGPDPRSAAAVLDLMLPLSLSHPSVPHLLALKPLARPSGVSHSHLAKFVGRVNTAVLGREGEASARHASGIASQLVRDDEEGWVMSEYGKGWVNTCLTELSTQATMSIPVHRLALLQTLILQSPQYPSFEREAIHPIMGKVSVTLTRLLGSVLEAEHVDLQALTILLQSMYNIIKHSPSPFRPSTPSIRTLVQSLLVPPTADVAYPANITELAADVLASLHLTNGKAQIPASWSTDIKAVLGAMGMALNGIVGEGWAEEPYRVVPPAGPPGYTLPTDPTERLPLALEHLNGWVEAVLALLRYPTSRPVPVPIAQIVAAGLRCLNLTLDTPTLPYISPQHRASLIAALPRIWTAGLQLLAAVATSVGDHLYPHLSLILDHTVYLAETVPTSMVDSHLQLLRFHSIFLDLYPASLVPVEYPTRLLKLSLGYLSPLLESRTQAGTGAEPVTNGTSKRGKKRARGAEDGLVGGLEGRERRALAAAEIEIIVESLNLVPLLHPTPTLSPALLTLSIRLHLSLYLGLPGLSHLIHPPSQIDRLREALATLLEKAACMNEGEGGTSRGWKSVILSVMEPRRDGSAFSLMLHPSLPPLHRPLPPLSQLHFFTTETEDEKKLRLELGLGMVSDDKGATGEDETMAEAELELAVISREDSAQPSAPRITVAPVPAPAASSLPAAPAPAQATEQHADTHTATITTPAISDQPPVRVDTVPESQRPFTDDNDPLAPNPATAPLTASSNDLYPAPVGPARTNLNPPKQRGPAAADKPMEVDDDDDDEPLPELDSDMDLSDDGEEEEEGGDEE